VTIAEILKAKKEKEKGKKKDKTIYSPAYYTLGGLIAGFGLVYLWDKLGIPGQDHKIKNALVTGHPIHNAKEITVDKTVALTLAVGLMLSELMGVKGGMASGSGFLLGYTVGTDYRKGKALGNV
jgi:hypothetical protein